MTADIILIFAAYCISVIALLVSIYALWSLDEIKEQYKQKYVKSRHTKVMAKSNPSPKTTHIWKN